MNNIAILFIFFFLFKKNGKREFISPSFTNFNFKLDTKTTNEKIKFIKKIAPYFPKEHLNSVNKAIITTEKMLKVYETINFIQEGKQFSIVEHIPVENHKERLSYIANTIQNDFSEENIKKLGHGADLILKIDKYNKMMDMFNYIASNPDILNDTNKMFKLVEPFLKGKDKKEMKKFKEMSKLMNILKALDSPKNEKDKKDLKDENL